MQLPVFEWKSGLLYCSFTERIEWIALAVAVNLVGSRVLLESRPARSVIFLG